WSRREGLVAKTCYPGATRGGKPPPGAREYTLENEELGLDVDLVDRLLPRDPWDVGLGVQVKGLEIGVVVHVPEGDAAAKGRRRVPPVDLLPVEPQDGAELGRP